MNFKRYTVAVLGLLLSTLALTGEAQARNLHVIDEDKATGYRLIRMGRPSAGTMQKLCDYGPTKVIVLSGDGSVEKNFARDRCPTLEVIFDKKTLVKYPLTTGFLKFFDDELAKAKAGGYTLAFRCTCGCHRTGRLAGYFNIKYKKMSADAAFKDLKKKMTFGAKFMHKRKLHKQLIAIESYLNKGGKCPFKKKKQKRKWCIVDSAAV